MLKHRLEALQSDGVWNGGTILIPRGGGASRHEMLKREDSRMPEARLSPRYSQPFWRAIWAASMRLRAPVFWMPAEM